MKAKLLKKAALNFDPWIGVDLDGSLAQSLEDYSDPTLIGEPIPAMVEKVRAAIDKGYTVKVFTARMADEEHIDRIREAIAAWTEKHIGTALEATNEKDPGMVYLVDDKARQVVEDTGKVVTAKGPARGRVTKKYDKAQQLTLEVHPVGDERNSVPPSKTLPVDNLPTFDEFLKTFKGGLVGMLNYMGDAYQHYVEITEIDGGKVKEIAYNDQENKYDDITDLFRSFTFPLPVYREVTLSNGIASLKTSGIGIYWTWDANSAEAHWGSFGSGDKPYLIRAEIQATDVDWYTSILCNLDPSLGDSEKEIRLREGARVDITGWKQRKEREWHWPWELPINVTAAKIAREDYNEDGYWANNNGASGVLPIAQDSKRICLAWRSSDVHMGDCWGTLGGAIKDGHSPAESAEAEMAEEVGYHGSLSMHPAYVFQDGKFKYSNFIGVVPSEFPFSPASGHSWETDHIEWFTYDEIVKGMEENTGEYHPGLIKLFKNSRGVIQKLTKGGDSKEASEAPLDVTYKILRQRNGNGYIIDASLDDPIDPLPLGKLKLSEGSIPSKARMVFVEDVIVDPGFRRRGIGYSLYRKAITLAQRKGFERFQQGTPRTEDADKIWMKLAQEFTVQKDENGSDFIDLTNPTKTANSRADSVTPSILGKAVKRFCRSDAAFNLLDETTANGGTWTSGGCWILADAIQSGFGGELYTVFGKPGTDPEGDRRPQHMMVKFGGTFIDADGASSSRALLRRWTEAEGVLDATLEPLDASTVRPGIPAPPQKRAEIINGVRSFLGESSKTASPDFGYTQFNDREKDLKRLSFQMKGGTDWFKINCADGYIRCSSRVPDVPGYTVEECFIDDLFRGTGLGQLLYDKALQEIKKRGGERLWSDVTRTPDAEKAWKRLSQRYPVTFEEQKNRYRLDLKSRKPKAVTSAVAPDITYRNECTGYSGQETYCRIVAQGAEGNQVGSISYGIYQDEIHIKMIEVDPKFRRQGIATQLMAKLRSENPGLPIHWGMLTDDGSALKEKIHQPSDEPPNRLFAELEASREDFARDAQIDYDSWPSQITEWEENNPLDGGLAAQISNSIEFLAHKGTNGTAITKKEGDNLVIDCEYRGRAAKVCLPTELFQERVGDKWRKKEGVTIKPEDFIITELKSVTAAGKPLAGPLQDLQNYLTMDDRQQAESLAAHFPEIWEESTEGTEEEGILPEEASDNSLTYFYQMNWRILKYDDPEACPAFLFLDYEKTLRNAWVVHFTDHALAIAKEGFTRGVEDLDRLALTLLMDAEDKQAGGYAFGFPADASAKFIDSISREPGYGKQAVLCKVDAVVAHHNTDRYSQAIFWGQDAKVRIPVIRKGDGWVALDANGAERQEAKELSELVAWAKQSGKAPRQPKRPITAGETKTTLLKTAAASPELGYLRDYMKMDDRDKATEMAYSFSGSFASFLREEHPDIAEKVLDDEEDFLEDVSEVPTPVLKEFMDSSYVHEIMQNEPHYAPLFMHSDYQGDVNNEWLVHFTDHATQVAKEGFTRGVEDFRQLGLTTHFKEESKTGGGYNFAFEVHNINRHAFRRSRNSNSHYGRECVIFKASGIKVFHYGDEEPQVIFWGKDARYIIPVYRNYDNWALPDGPEGEPLQEDENLEVLCAWVEQNYAKYKKFLTPSMPKKGRRTAADNQVNAYGLDPEAQQIVDRYEAQGVAITLSGRGDYMKLDAIHVPKENRNQGIGSQFMEELVAYADRAGKTVFLTPSKDFGATSVARLRKFYSRFGFKPNKGRNKDFRSWDAMVRQPKKPLGKKAKGPIDFSKDPEWHDLFYGTPDPKRLKELNQFLKKNPEQIIRLYHGTDARLPIMEQGLLPTSSKRRRSLQSGSGYVYLSVYPDMAETFGRIGNPSAPIEVYVVQLPARMLLPDKDQLKNKRMWGEDPNIGTTLADSLVIGHAACVKGTIMPWAIRPTKSKWDPNWSKQGWEEVLGKKAGSDKNPPGKPETEYPEDSNGWALFPDQRPGQNEGVDIGKMIPES